MMILDDSRVPPESRAMKKRKPSLVLVAHGSKSDGWSQLVEKCVEQVRDNPGMRDVFGSICCAFLEHAQQCDRGSRLTVSL